MKNLNKKIIFITIIVIFSCVIMAIVDGIIKPPYLLKSIFKIFLFFALPMIYLVLSKEDFKKLFIPSKKGLLISLGLGFLIYFLIIGTYFFAKNFYDFNSITNLLENNVGVTGKNFVFVSIYISLCNSLLEEFFFRGFSFLILSKLINKKFAYIFSSFMFAIYHIAIMIGWFSPLIFILALIGLMVGGILFNYINEKTENIYNSWMAHMFANFAINTIGFILFGII